MRFDVSITKSVEADTPEQAVTQFVDFLNEKADRLTYHIEAVYNTYMTPEQARQ